MDGATASKVSDHVAVLLLRDFALHSVAYHLWIPDGGPFYYFHRVLKIHEVAGFRLLLFHVLVYHELRLYSRRDDAPDPGQHHGNSQGNPNQARLKEDQGIQRPPVDLLDLQLDC